MQKDHADLHVSQTPQVYSSVTSMLRKGALMPKVQVY